MHTICLMDSFMKMHSIESLKHESFVQRLIKKIQVY